MFLKKGTNVGLLIEMENDSAVKQLQFTNVGNEN